MLVVAEARFVRVGLPVTHQKTLPKATRYKQEAKAKNQWPSAKDVHTLQRVRVAHT